MNPALLRVLIAVSLVANLALGVKLAGQIAERRAREERDLDLASAAAAARASAKLRRSWIAPETWSQLTEGGNTTLAANLLAAGFPRDVARAMIDVRVREHFSDWQKVITEARINTPFWRRHLRWTYADEKIRASERALAREQADRTRQLWNVPEEPGDRAPSPGRWFYGEAAAKLMDGLSQFREGRMQEMSDINEHAGGVLFRDELERLVQLDHADTKAVAAVVSPDEFDQLDRALNPTSRRIRSDAKLFEPTASELHGLVELFEPFDEQVRNFVVLSPAEAQARATERAELHRQAEALLGTERFAAYLSAAEKNWLEASRFTLAHQLPPAATEQILAIQADLTTRGNGAAEFAEVSARLSAALGVENVTAYRDGPGVWFRRLKPQSSKVP